MARDSFIFYRSFYEAISELPKENQADSYNAIMRYALDQEEIELTGISKAIFSLVKPQLDANYKKYENGKQKKSKTEAKQKQTPYGVEVLVAYSKDMPTDLIIYAMQISVEANKRTIKYIKAILNNWQKAGIRTLVQAKDENHKKKNESKEIEEWLNE